MNNFIIMTKKEVFDYINSGIDKNGSLKKENGFKNHFPELYDEYLHASFPEPINSLPFKQKLWHFLNDVYTIPVCKTCGNPVTFETQKGLWGYRTYCSGSCGLHNKEIISKRLNTCLEKYGAEYYTQTEQYKRNCELKYGVNNFFKTDEFKKKAQETNIEKYGKDYYSQTDEWKDKVKDTCMIKYGVEWSSKSEESKLNSIKTCLEKYGKEHISQINEIKQKIKQTTIQKYGKEYYSQTNEWKDKVRSTCLEKYGVESYSQTNEWKDKFIQTCMNRYKKENYSQTNESKYKSKQTCLEKYGKETYSQTDEWKEKVRDTCIEKYGVEWISMNDDFKEKQYNTKKQNNSFNSSSIEKQFDEFLKSLNIEYISQYKSNVYPYMCDFYIPFLDLYIEIQGSWTHGGHPFDENNKDDLDKLNLWNHKNSKYYNNAIYTWTKRDIKKRNTAKENNLNYLEIFTDNLDECITVFEEYLNSLL